MPGGHNTKSTPAQSFGSLPAILPMRLFILIVSLFSVTSSIAQQVKLPIDFSIRFTGCFENDTISLKISDTQIFKSKIISTDKSDGVTDIYIFQDITGLWIDTKTNLQKINISNKILLDISINNKHEKFELKKKYGKYILIDKCHGQGSFIGWRNLTVTQQHKLPVFD